MSFILTAYIQKGGTGKTTIITNLGSMLTHLEPQKKVLIIEFDFQGNAFSAFGKHASQVEYTLVDALLGHQDVSKCIYHLHDQLYMLPSSRELAIWEMDILINKHETTHPFKYFEPILKKLTEEYDYILIDAPPSMNAISGNILSANSGYRNHIIIPFKLERSSVEGLLMAKQTIDEMSAANDQLNIIGFLPSMKDVRTSLHTKQLDDAVQFCEENDFPLFETIIPLSIMYPGANSVHGKTLTWLDPKNKYSKVFEELWQEIVIRAGGI